MRAENFEPEAEKNHEAQGGPKGLVGEISTSIMLFVIATKCIILQK